MAGENEKKLRTIAKRKFTRCYNRLNDAITDKAERDLVVTKFNDLKQLWGDVQSKHDDYLIAKYPDEDEDADYGAENTWLNDIEERFEIVQKVKCDYLRWLEAEREHTSDVKLKEEKSSKSKEEMESALLHRNNVKLMLRQEIKNIEDNMRRDSVGVLKSQVIDDMKCAKSHLERCKDAHLVYISYSTNTNPEEENEWIEDVQALYERCNEKLYNYLKGIAEIQMKEKQRIVTKMESIRMPSFSGNIRAYAKFKSDFKSQIEEKVDSAETLAYVLRSCLKNEAAYLVENIDDAVGIWDRLDRRYGQPSLLIDVVMDEIKSIDPLREENPEEFIKVVNIIEKGYADLQRLKLEKEISNSVTVSMLEGRLPPTIRREWSREVNKAESKVDPCNKFPPFMTFLKEQRTILEYEMANLRLTSTEEEKYASVNHGLRETQRRNDRINFRCNLHKMNNHWTEECREYINKTPQERFETIKNLKACWSCLKVGHRLNECRFRNECSVNGCKMFHHPSLHDILITGAPVNVVSSSIGGVNERSSPKCLLQIMKIPSINHDLSILWDSGASISLITFRKAKELKLTGKNVQLSVIKVGGQTERISSCLYTLPLVDKHNVVINVKVYGIENISQGPQGDDCSSVLHMFKGVDPREVQRPTGEIDALIGFNYASLHPTMIQSSDNLMLMANRFGMCLAGSHYKLRDTQKLVANNVEIYHVVSNEESFLNIEEMGIQCFPLCGNCSCKKCALGSKGLSIKEEREQNLINEGLSYIENERCFVSTYPWTKDPDELPDNYYVAKQMLESTERRLSKDTSHAKTYNDQIVDLVERGVARILTEEEMNSYDGPKYYLSHHEVMKRESSTPCRIVFNSSAKYMNECINDYWAKGAKLVNSLVGVLVRFRENQVAIIGDIRKMYHAVKISLLDQHTHRFLWRNMEVGRKPDVYVMTSVSFGDKPAGNIAMAALNKTAEIGKCSFPRAAETVVNNTYVDDIIDSYEDVVTAKRVTGEIDQLLKLGGFEVKEWVISSSNFKTIENEKKTFAENEHNVLGMHWESSSDVMRYSIKLNFSCKKRGVKVGLNLLKEDIPIKLPVKLTKRMVLSQINSIFDPLGLLSPFTVKAKFLLKNLWRKKLDWDEEITGRDKDQITSFFEEMFDVEAVSFRRCLKPENAIDDPVLITFSDASIDAFGACTYLRWKLNDESYKSVLVAAKNRVSPLKVLSIVRLELCAAVIAKRLAQFVEEETRFRINKRYFFVDSQVVKSMICKESHAFNTFVAVRLGEIHHSTNADEWYWIDGSDNIADWITRGRIPTDLSESSLWQCGPEFLSRPEEAWPINKSIIGSNLPEEHKVVVVSNVEEVTSIENVIDINKHSKYLKLIYITARIISVFKFIPKPSLSNLCNFPSDFIFQAETMWIIEAQKLLKGGLEKGDYKGLCPRVREDGVIIVEGRLESWFADNYNTSCLILLPHNHKLSHLYAEYIHSMSHLGTASTICKIRDRFWITKLTTMVSSIRRKCVKCRKMNAEFQQQIMAQVPLHRLKPAPAFHNTYIDFFGPFKIRGVVNKRSCGKAFGLIFTCGNSRAVHCDLSPNYSMDGFLQALRRFTSIRGFPADIWSDCGSQLVATDKELRNMVKGFDKEKLKEFGADKGVKWHFSPPDAPWHNGCAESLVKSVKRALKVAIGNQILSFPELQTVLFEVSNIVNERPIGVHNKNIDDGRYLCPNSLILGRASSRVPSGPFNQKCSPKRRFLFIQKLIDCFWKIWIRDYFPSLMVRQKWHVEKRDMKVGDVVLMRDLNAVRGHWQLGEVAKVYPSDDNRIRKVDVRYKIHSNKNFSIAKRAVQSLVILLPIEENNDID